VSCVAVNGGVSVLSVVGVVLEGGAVCNGAGGGLGACVLALAAP
jgi:hypothetical protein